ncbi:MAG: AMP-binding protein, partial [Sinobacterium sp.]|nr:AMP-binding protein [Sinobacterium sp.]
CLSAYALLLQQHSKQDDICVGVPLAGRSLEGVDQLIGFFINALVIRNDFSANLSREEILKQTKQQVLSAFAHEHVPIEMLLNELDIERSLAYTPVAQCAFNMISGDNSLNELFDSSNLPLSMDLIETEQVVAKFDLQFSLFEFEDNINLSIEYASDLFSEETVSAFYHGYIYILEAFAASTSFSIYTLQKEFNLDNSQAGIQALPPVIEDMYLGTVTRPDTLENSMAYGLDLPLAIDIKLWKEALKNIAQQHSMCRAYIGELNFTETNPVLMQRQLIQNADIAVFHIHPSEGFSVDPQFEFIDYSERDISLSDIQTIAENNSNTPYPAGSESLLFYRLYKLSNESYYFNMTCSHLISDGLSALNHAALVAEHYEGLLKDASPSIQKTDYFPAYIQQSLQEFDRKDSLEFWKERLAGVESLSCRALNKDSQILKTLPLEPEHFIAIKQFCKQNIITPAIYFKSIYAILIKLYTRTESDFIITEFNPGRTKGTLHDLGCFFHSQPFLIQIDALSDQLTPLFKALKSEQKASRKHLKISNRQLRQLLPKSQLQFSFNFLAFDHHIHLNDMRINGDRFTPNADGLVDFRVQADGNDISLWIAYNGLLFDDKDFLERYLHLSQQLLNGSAQQLSSLEYVLPNERSANKLVFTPPSVVQQDIPVQLTHQMIGSAAARSPSNTAVISGDEKLSYGELEAQANALANILIEHDVKVGDRVSILLPKRVELISSLLACMKVGACYVPIDTNYPAERIAYILSDSQSTVCITQQSDIDKVTGEAFILNIDTQDLSKQTSVAPFIDVRPDDAIYMIYTSGSTGKPKAASVYHHSEARLLEWYCKEYAFDQHDKTLVMSATGFDLSQKNFFALLTQGGTVVFPSSDHYDVESLLIDIEKHSITVINCAPSAFYPLVELNNDEEFSQLNSLKQLLLGGESIQLQRLQYWIQSP